MGCMPTCEGCGEEYPKGGAYTTHVTHCDEANKQDGDANDEFQPEELETRVEELEDHVFTQSQHFEDELDWISGRLDTVEKLVDQAANNQDKIIERQKELRNEYKEFARAVMELQEKHLLESLENTTDREFESFEQARHWMEAEVNDSGQTSLERALKELPPNQQTEIDLEE